MALLAACLPTVLSLAYLVLATPVTARGGGTKDPTVIPQDYSGPLGLTGKVTDADGNACAITAIESRAFVKCIELSSVALPEGFETFGPSF